MAQLREEALARQRPNLAGKDREQTTESPDVVDDLAVVIVTLTFHISPP